MLFLRSCQSRCLVVRVRTYCLLDLITPWSCYCCGYVKAHHQMLHCVHIVAVILSEATNAIAFVMTEPAVSCQSPHIQAPLLCHRLLLLSPWSSKNPLSVVTVCTYSHHDLARRVSGSRPGHESVIFQVLELICILAVICVMSNMQWFWSKDVFHYLPFNLWFYNQLQVKQIQSVFH
jgi:hypothetical protein